MFDFRLKVFYTVAKRLNFTKAADELFITQPAVTKHIHEIENYFKVKLFDRNGTKISLTEAGETLLQHTGKMFSLYRNLEFDLSLLTKQHNGKLKIGASTTVAQYVISQILASFHEKFKDIEISMISGNTEQIEHALTTREIDIGIIEGYSKANTIKYTEFLKDEIVLVSNAKNPLLSKPLLKLDDLLKVPLLLRESGSGTLEVISHALKSVNISLEQLQVEMYLSSTESIKQYLSYSDCFAFLSVYSILKELKNKELFIVDIENLNIERYFYFIQLQGQVDALPDLFMQFASHYNLK